MSQPFKNHRGRAAPFIRDNVDTDQIIPSREMKSVSKTGLSTGLFAGQRYIQAREPNPDFVLNDPRYIDATILLCGRNFGCGSSREHAVWALKDYGFRAVIAESFGEIFYNNCVRNGILPVSMNGDIIAALGDDVAIDLEAQTVDGHSFDIADGDKDMLLKGLDPIRLTLQKSDQLDAYFEADKSRRPWVYTQD